MSIIHYVKKICVPLCMLLYEISSVQFHFHFIILGHSTLLNHFNDQTLVQTHEYKITIIFISGFNDITF